MLDFKTEIVTALTPILPTYYDYVRDDSMSFPCITYIEYRNDQDSKMGSNMAWSTVGYTIKIWDKSVSNITAKALLVDTAMRDLGYTRVGSQEQIESNQVCKIMLYSAYCDEHF